MSPTTQISKRDYQARLREATQAMLDMGLDTAVLTNPADITYLTGVWPVSVHEREAIVALKPKNPTLLLSSLRAVPDIPKPWRVVPLTLENLKASCLTSNQRIGAQFGSLSLSESKRWFERELSDFGAMEVLRRHKQSSEIHLLTRLRTQTLTILDELASTLESGVTELEVSAWIRARVERLGAVVPEAFLPIVAFGDHSAICHHTPTKKTLTSESAVLVDMGIGVAGYHSDLTRSWWFGHKPPPAYQTDTQSVQTMFSELVSQMKPGVLLSDVVRCYQDLCLRHSGREPIHALGHGVGVSVHEAPHFGSKTEGVLKKGEVIALEPGIYRPGLWGIRHEDMVSIGEEGARLLEEANQSVNEPQLTDK